MVLSDPTDPLECHDLPTTLRSRPVYEAHRAPTDQPLELVVTQPKHLIKIP